MIPSPERFAGCLIGECVGDAMGMPAEGRVRSLCAEWVEVIRDSGAPHLDGLPLPLGQYTDDSQLARELAISCVECGGFDPEDFALRLARLFDEGRVVGGGLATARAAARLAAGAPWEKAGEPPPSAGNGTAMRSAPLGLLYAHDHDELVHAAHRQGYCTHRDARCSAGSVAIAMACALAATDGEHDPDWFCARIAERMERFDHGFAALLRRLPETAGAPIDEALAWIAPAGLNPEEADAQPYDFPAISPFVVPSVLWSLHAFLSHPHDFLEAILLAIAPGGDVDTTAAMTGAIGGACLGVEGIPRELRELVQDDGSWRAPELEALAKRLHDVATTL